MIIDDRLEFADDASVVHAAGTFVVGDVVDLGTSPANLGVGEDLYLVIRTGSTEIVTGGTAGTIKFYLVSDALNTLGGGVPGSCTKHLESSAFVTDDAAANAAELSPGGNLLVAKLPLHAEYERYLGIICEVGTTATTAGTINAFLTHDVTAAKAYPDAL